MLQGATQRCSSELPNGTPAKYTMGHAQCFLSGVSCHITFEYVMSVLSVQVGALRAGRPVGLSVRWEPGCMYTQGKGYFMHANALHTCWTLTLGNNVSVLLLIVG